MNHLSFQTFERQIGIGGIKSRHPFATGWKLILWGSLFAFLMPWSLPGARAAAVVWTGGGDGFSWSQAQNWGGGTVPISTDDVTIPSGAPRVQISGGTVTVKSLSSARTVVVDGGAVLRFNGTSALTSGIEVIDGALIASGSTTVVSVSGAATSIHKCNIDVISGAKLTIFDIANFTLPEGANTSWSAQSAGSELNFPNLLTISGNATQGNIISGYYVNILARSGGRVNLPALTTITKPFEGDGYANSGVRLYAENNSILSAPLLHTFHDNDVLPNSLLNAVGTGMIEAPQLLEPIGVQINLNAESHPERFTSLVNTRSFTLNRGTVTIADLDTITGFGHIQVVNGAKLTFAGVSNFTLPENKLANWYADDAGSELNFPNLVTITGNATQGNIVSGYYLSIFARFGGRVNLPALTTITKPFEGDGYANSGVRLYAENNSILSAPLLHTFHDNDVLPNSLLNAVGTGVIEAPQLLEPIGVQINLNAESHPERFTSLVNTRSFTLNRGTVTIADLDTITGFGHIQVVNGAKLTFAGVSNFTLPENKLANWYADDAGSELNFPNLVTITGNATQGNIVSGYYLSIFARSGGRVNLPALTTITKPFEGDGYANSGVRLYAENNSILSAPLLHTFHDNDILPNSLLNAVGTGVIEAPQLLEPIGVQINLNAESHPERFTSLVNTRSFILNRGAVTITDLDTITGFGHIQVVNGAKLTFAGVNNFTLPENKVANWYADDAGSELNFPNLVTITGNATQGNIISGYYLSIFARSGGRVNLPALTTITKPFEGDGYANSGVRLYAENNSILSAPLLHTFHDNDILPNSLLSAVGSGVLEIGRLMSIRGVIWNSSGILNISVGTAFSGFGTINRSVTNFGTLQNNSTGRTLNIQGSLIGTGIVRITNDASLALTGSLTLDDPAKLDLSIGSSLQIKGSFLGDTTQNRVVDPGGTLLLNGAGTALTPQLVEVMSADRGAGQEAFKNNFVFGAFSLGANTFVRLVDQFENSGSGAPECVYANTLIVPVGSTLDLNGLKLYTRGAQVLGSVINGAITQLPDSGQLSLNSIVPGSISESGQLDEWIFFARVGTSLTVALETGGANVLTPPLARAELRLVDASGAVISSVSSTSNNQTLTFSNFPIPSTGNYRIQVKAAATHSANVGNYLIAAWNATPDINNLVINQQHTGRVENPYSVDRWEFSALAGQQLRLDLLNASNAGLSFSLNGPNDWIGFEGVSGDSELVTVPFSGSYTLTAYGTGSSSDLAYSFRLVETQPRPLIVNDPYSGAFVGNGQADLFRLELTSGGPLELILQNLGASNRTEIYASRGVPPTRSVYEYGSISGNGANRRLLIPSASAGVLYILVYADKVPAPGPYTLEAKMAGVALTSLSSTRQAVNAPTQISITGAGFGPGATVELVSDTGTLIPASTVTIDSFTQITASFPADIGSPGTYGVRVSLPDGSIAVLPEAFVFLPAGEGKLETKLILPDAFGRHAVGKIYVEYENTGNASMPAPLLIVKSADLDGSDRPILTLDSSRIIQNFWSGTNGLPPGTSNEVLILASGAQPGVLNPGERMTVPVHYLGLQQPWNFSDTRIEMEVRHWAADDPAPIDWAARKEALRPPTLASAVWDVVYENLTSDLDTNADYVRMLNENAQYLSRLGLRVLDVDDLWNFEVQQAYGYSALPVLDSTTDADLTVPGTPLSLSRTFSSNLRSRNSLGLFGQGWFTDWQTTLVSERGGSLVKILGEAGSARVFSKDTRGTSYFSDAGDSSKLEEVAGAFELHQPNGTFIRFRPDGRIDYVQDANGNRVTATWDGGLRLTGLAHNSGGSIALSYGGNGLVTQLTESTGRSVTYAYQGNYLVSATTDDGKVTSYTYDTAGAPSVRHALLSASEAGVTRSFTWDARGRLQSTFVADDEELVVFSYDSAGGVSISQGGGTRSLFFEHRGLLASMVDPFGHVTTAAYDSELRLQRLVLPTGESKTFAWCSCGSPTSITDELGYVTRFSYDHPLKKMTRFVDAKGNATLYSYDEKGNALATTYADHSVERTQNHTPAGLPQTRTNRRGQSIQYTYTASGQVDRQAFPDGSYDDFDYDNRGNLIQITEHPVSGPDKITIYTYDPGAQGDRLRRIDYPGGKWVDYFYDQAGRRVRMADSAGGDTSYEYDDAGRLWKLTDSNDDLIVEYLYDGAGRLDRINKGNGTYTTYQYDPAGQILHLTNFAPGGTVNSRFSYTYDSRGRRTSMETLDGEWTYGYDATGQLIRAVFDSTNPLVEDQDLQYAYDALGNRTSTVENGVVTVYVSNNINQYTSVGGVAQEYDADGNLVFDGDRTLEYDDQNSLVRVVSPNGVSEYDYNALGFRIAGINNGAHVDFLLDETEIGDVIAEQSTESTKRYVYGNGLVARSPNLEDRFDYFDFDAIGSVSDVTLENGMSAGLWMYSPFGGVLRYSGSAQSSFRAFGGHGVSQDPSELYCMRARFFDSRTGRFTSMDPIRLAGGDLNFYRYSYNSPLNFIDPTGTSCWYETAGFFGGWAGGGAVGARVGKSARGFTSKAGAVLGGRLGLAFGPVGGVVGFFGGGLIGYFAPNIAGGYIGRKFGSALGRLLCDQDPHPGSDPSPGGSGIGSPGGDGSGGSAGSFDPNEKLGPGFGPQGWVPADALLPYRINFENLGPGSKDENGDPYTVFATAPAQRVTISDQLEAALDWNSFEITEFGWGDTLINVPPGTSHFTDTVRMTQGDKVFNVEIAAGIDFSLGRIFVRFQSMDLESGLPPDVLTGFLPPEDGTGIGMGHFAYTIRTKPSLPAGTEIRNVALITFDLNESISTDQIDPQDPAQGIDPDRQALVTLDPDKPTSTIDVLNVTSRTSSFLVGWAGSDVGAGIHGYDIYVSDNGGPWQIWLSGTTETSATFEGEFGHSYGFLSVARDQAGNVQERGNTAQATVVVAPADGRSEKVVQSPDQEFGVSSATPIDDWAADWDVAKVAIYDGLLRDQTDGTTLLGGIDRMLVSPPRVGASNGGLVSATIRVKGRSFKVRGGFDSQGLFDQDFIQKDGTTLSIDLRLMETESGNEAIRGTISWNGTIAQADLPRAPYSKANPAPAGLVGAYTVVFPSQTNWGFDQPGGDGWALASVSQAGVIAIKGVLGDGTPFSDLAFLSADADASVYTELYRTTPERGRFGGKIVFRDQPNISDFDGVMQWKKFADSRDLRYPNGFDVDVWALGSRFVVPQAPTSRVLSSLADQHHNAEISFFGPTAPGNDPAGLDRVVSWLANNRLVHYGPERLGATASPRNGLLVGAFLDASTGVRVKFSGVAYQKQGFAAGVFVNGTASGAIRVVPGTAFSYPGSEDAGALSRIDPPSTPTDGPVEMDQLAFVSEASGIYAGVVLDPGSEEAIGAIEGFKLDGNGGFSGALWFQGKRHGFKGLGFGTEIEIPRINQDSIFLTITLTRIEGSGDGFGLGGVIKINGSMVGTPDGQRMPRFTKIDRSPQEGSYTASMRAPDNVDPSIEPGGDGSATFSVSYLGIINGLVTLPEGTRVSMGGHVGRSYGAPDATFAEWSFHRGLYGKIPRGYLAGKLFFNRANGASITDLDGRWHWVKESGIASASSYPGGFDITRDVIGGTYTIPAKGVRAMAGLDDDWWNLWLRFVGPDLSNLDTLTLESNDLAATWTTGNRVLYFGPEVIRIDFDARTGRLAGSYIDKPSGVSVRFGGVLLQTQSRVGGSYITNGSNGPISGLFIANPR